MICRLSFTPMALGMYAHPRCPAGVLHVSLSLCGTTDVCDVRFPMWFFFCQLFPPCAARRVGLCEVAVNAFAVLQKVLDRTSLCFGASSEVQCFDNFKDFDCCHLFVATCACIPYFNRHRKGPFVFRTQMRLDAFFFS